MAYFWVGAEAGWCLEKTLRQSGLNLTSRLEQMSGSMWTLKSIPGRSGANSSLARDGLELPIGICLALEAFVHVCIEVSI